MEVRFHTHMLVGKDGFTIILIDCLFYASQRCC